MHDESASEKRGTEFTFLSPQRRKRRVMGKIISTHGTHRHDRELEAGLSHATGTGMPFTYLICLHITGICALIRS